MIAALRQHGHHVVSAVDGLEALEAVQAGHFDVIVSDAVMPRLDGPALVRELRTRDIETPIVLCSGYSEELHKSTNTLEFCEHFLQKPYTLAQLLGHIAEAVKTPL